MESVEIQKLEGQIYDDRLSNKVNEVPNDNSEDEWQYSGTSSDEEVIETHTSIETFKRKSSFTQKLKFKCPVNNCTAAYRKNWLLEDHVRKHNRERPFKCTIGECSKSYTKEPHLKRHKILVHEKVCELICDVEGCGTVLNNKYSLKKHKLKVHNASSWSFFCNECSIGFKKKYQLSQHNFKHTGEPPFKCTICNTGFILQRDLTKHKRNHKTYTCDCGEIFERWSRLRSHRKRCMAKKQGHVCPFCKKTFTEKYTFQQHATSHDNDETFHCPYIDCNRSYLYKKNLKFHISVFHERKVDNEDLPCPDCGKMFSKKMYLNRHIKNIHNAPPKVDKPRKPRKDKGQSRTFMAAALSGVRLTQRQNKEMLLNPAKILTIQIPNLENYQIESSVEENQTDIGYSEKRNLAEINKQNNCTQVNSSIGKEAPVEVDNITNTDALLMDLNESGVELIDERTIHGLVSTETNFEKFNTNLEIEINLDQEFSTTDNGLQTGSDNISKVNIEPENLNNQLHIVTNKYVI